jgi:hypothetical protein
VGTWGVALYSSDTARDLRDDLKRVVRAPWDADQIRVWAAENYGALDKPSDSDHTDLWLVLADRFWSYGIKHGETFERALEIIEGGADLESKLALGMGEKDLARRAKVLEELAAKWARPNERPSSRRVLSRPEPFVFDVGDCFVYPTSDGKPRNPYVSAKREAWYYGAYPWEQNGWGAAIVLSRSHRYTVFARYVVGFLAIQTHGKPTLAEMTAASLRSFDQIGFVRTPDGGNRDQATPRPYVFAVTASRSRLARMRIEVVGRLEVDAERVATDFDPDQSAIARFGVSELVNHASTRRHSDVDGPIAKYLKS